MNDILDISLPRDRRAEEREADAAILNSGRGHRRAARFSWVDASVELPDDEMTVVVAMDDGEVWTWFHLEGQWRYVSADPIGAKVTHWADFPDPPGRILEPDDGDDPE